MNGENILNIAGLNIKTTGGKTLVNDVSINIKKGEILGIVGESGSGKTMIARAILGLMHENLNMTVKSNIFDGLDMDSLSDDEKRRITGTKISFVPQNTVHYLHPLLRIKDQISDSYCLYKKKTRKEGQKRAGEMLSKVGFDNPERVLNSYPWELSGGMKQRVNIAMAMMNEPLLLVVDEPTTALDCTAQKQVIKLLAAINRDMGVSTVFISHDLGLIKMFCHRIMVMYAGRIMEEGTSEDIFKRSMHPYTKALIDVIPSASRDKNIRLAEIPGYVPEICREMDKCIFMDRCSIAQKQCNCMPPLYEDGGHKVYCHSPQIGFAYIGRAINE